MDEDLQTMDRAALVAEVSKLRTGIRKHRDTTGHELCWHHPDLWDLGLAAGKDAAVDRRAALAEIHARLYPLSPVAGRAGSGRAVHDREYGE